ncbi:MAG: prepilin-type N-terminal cleavage/methylation domain-containing protein [Gemmatimonadaceae bacterium]
MRRSRRGFTLIELMVSIVLTGLVAMLAYGSVQAGLDSSARIEDYRRTTESEALTRSLIADALRHLSDAPSGAVFEIERTVESGDILRFVSRGVTGPLGAGALWRVELGPSRDGFHFSALPLEGNLNPIRGSVASLRSISVRVLRAPDDVQWQDHWESTRQFPSAVEVSFLDSRGASSGSPLLVATALRER